MLGVVKGCADDSIMTHNLSILHIPTLLGRIIMKSFALGPSVARVMAVLVRL